MNDDRVFITIGEISRVLGPSFSPRRIRRWLDRAGALERRYGTVVTTPQRLAVAFPEVFQKLIAADLDDEDE